MPKKDLFQKTKTMIEDGTFKTANLGNLAENIEYHAELTDEQKAELMSLIKTRLRVEDPLKANKLFGKSAHEYDEMLQTVMDRIISVHDLSNNKHGSHVKAGGDEKNGSVSAHRYISYRHPDTAMIAALVIRLEKGADNPLVLVRKQHVKEQGVENMHYREYQLIEFEEAAACFEAYLIDVLQGETTTPA